MYNECMVLILKRTDCIICKMYNFYSQDQSCVQQAFLDWLFSVATSFEVLYHSLARSLAVLTAP